MAYTGRSGPVAGDDSGNDRHTCPLREFRRRDRGRSVSRCCHKSTDERSEVRTTDNKWQRDYMAPRARRSRVEGRRNRSKADLCKREARTKPECHSSRFGLGQVMSTVEIESARTKTGDARIVTAGPLPTTALIIANDIAPA